MLKCEALSHHVTPHCEVCNAYWPGVEFNRSSEVVCQSWAVDLAPTDLKYSPMSSGTVSTPLPIKLLSHSSPSRHLD